MATPTGGLDLAGLIQAAQLGRSLNPEVMQQQALGNQFAQQLQQLQIAKLQRDAEDFYNPQARAMREFQAQLAGEINNPLKGTIPLTPTDVEIIQEQGNIPSPGSITASQQAGLLAAPAVDETGFPVLTPTPRASLQDAITGLVGPGGVQTGFGRDLNRIRQGALEQRTIEDIINPPKPIIPTSGPFAGMAIDPNKLTYRDIAAEGGGTTLSQLTRAEQERLDAIERDKTLSAEERLFARQQELERIRQAGASQLEGQKQAGRETLGEIARKKETAAKPLSAQERSALFSLVGSKSLLGNALGDYDKLNEFQLSLNPITAFGGKVGPAAGRWEEFKSWAGYGDKDFKSFNARLRANLFQSARALQGAGVLTKDDILRMEEISPKTTEGREGFIGGVEGMRQIMLDRAEAFRDLNTSRMNPDELDALNEIINKLSSPVESVSRPSGATPQRRLSKDSLGLYP